MLSIQTCTAALSLRLGSTTENFSPFSFPHKNLQSQTSCTPMLITLLNSAAAFSLIGWATPVVDQFIMEKDRTARSPRGQQATHIKTSPKVLPTSQDALYSPGLCQVDVTSMVRVVTASTPIFAEGIYLQQGTILSAHRVAEAGNIYALRTIVRHRFRWVTASRSGPGNERQSLRYRKVTSLFSGASVTSSFWCQLSENT